MKKGVIARVNICEFRSHVLVWLSFVALVAASESVLTREKRNTHEDEVSVLLQHDQLMPVSKNNITKTKKDSVLTYSEHFQVIVPEPQPPPTLRKQPSFTGIADNMFDMETDFLVPAGPLLQRRKRQQMPEDTIVGSGSAPGEVQATIGLLPATQITTSDVENVLTQKLKESVPNFDSVSVTNLRDSANGVKSAEFTITFQASTTGDRLMVAYTLMKILNTVNSFSSDTVQSIPVAQVNPEVVEQSGIAAPAMCYLCLTKSACDTSGTIATCPQPSSDTSSGLFPWGLSQLDDKLKQDDNTQSRPISINFLFDTNIYETAYVGTEGIISFDKQYNPSNLKELGKTNDVIICVFCADIDTRNLDSSGNIYHQLYNDPSIASHKVIIDRASREIKLHAHDDAFQPGEVVVVTWDRVPPFVKDGFTSIERATFQSVLISSAEKSYVMSFYEKDAMGWSSMHSKNVVIGYSWAVNKYFTELSSQRESDISLDAIAGNTPAGLKGVYLYKVGEKSTELTEEQKCLKWYDEETKTKADFMSKVEAANIPPCPCSTKSLNFDRTFIDNGNSCYALKSFFDGFGKTCCFDSDGRLISSRPDSGNLQRYNQYAFYDRYVKNDKDPKDSCCKLPTTCDKYYEMRPTDSTCLSITDRKWADFYGDPHITTLDDVGFTFNGLGEYDMLQVTADGSTFVLHARTAKMELVTGTQVNATVFTAFGAENNKDGGKVFVEMSRTKTALVIYGNNRDYTADFANNVGFPVITSTLTLEKSSNTTLIITFSNQISLKVNIDNKLLTISVYVPLKYKTMTTGLLGNYNGDPSDDFKKRDGTQLPSTATERQLYDMGQTWQIELNATLSKLRYYPGYSPKDYVDPTFQPIFLDEVDMNKINSAITLCGGSTQKSCIYDYVLTGESTIALQTKTTQTESTANKLINENAVPVVTGPTSVEAVVGQSVTLVYKATDDQTDPPRYIVVKQPASGFTFDNATGTVVWTPADTTPVIISLTAVDGAGLQAAVLEVDIKLCTGCTGHGRCDYTTPQTALASTAMFQIASCACNTGWTGNNCAMDFDWCSTSPCSIGQTCTDLTPAEEVSRDIGYNCSACAAGYEYNGRKCQDVDECVTLTLCPANSACQNTIGSYKCVCNPGYRLDSLGKCIDIDECLEQSYNCVQECVNQVGGYSCQCHDGYTLYTDGFSCNETTVSALCAAANCDQVCTVVSNAAKCYCRAGYKMDQNKCVNVNECELNLCAQTCKDSEGSYQCSCYDGFRLASDNLDCEPCPFPTYGPSCSLTCNCHGHASSCDSTQGCVCVAGWSGVNCTDDVNECVVNPGVCRDGFLCTNTRGSYQCTCQPGFESNGTACADIDECGSQLDNCTHDCTNIIGSFVCSCRSGYNKQGFSKCVDINECSSGAATCEQICENVEGSYNCLCEFGFVLAEDRKHCVKIAEPCLALNPDLNCTDYCRVVDMKAECQCNYGYKLATDLMTCIDIDECTSTDPSIIKCSHTCTNTPGAFTCSCPTGMKLDKDLRTCINCNPDKWGDNCANTCNCDSIGSSGCDKVTGCQCNSGWIGTRCENDRDECSSTSVSCPVNSDCENLPGSYRCKCRTGYVTSGNTCVDVDECSTSSPCDHVCNNTLGSYTCSCYIGFKLLNKETCVDINECELKQDDCEQLCRNTVGAFACECYEGFNLDPATRKTCTAVTTCSGALSCAHKCRIVSGKEMCYCNKGYTLDSDNTTCTDINECSQNICSQSCANNNGGYTCGCTNGYKLESDGVTCRACDNGFYGADCARVCMCNIANTVTCNAIDGACTCRSGWSGAMCATNIDECTGVNAINCGSDAVCRDTPGSYVCDCLVGFVRVGSQCTACDGKTFFGQDCSQSCTCVLSNTDLCDTVNGSCTCKQGWEGSSCEVNVDECTRSPNLCPDLHDHCVDSNGSFACVCDSGYISIGQTCVDVNECLDSGLNNCQFACNNTEGSYTCYCLAGYTGTGNTCTDIDECDLKTDGCQQVCENKVGSYLCTCNHGYAVNTAQPKQCDDVNECLNSALNNCSSPSETCVNSDGGFRCDCSISYTRKDSVCISAKTSVLLTLRLDITNKDTAVHAGSTDPEYIALAAIIAQGIYDLLKPVVGDSLLPVKIESLNIGSVIARTTLEIDNTKTTRSASKLAKGIDSMLNTGRILINGSNTAILGAIYGSVPLTEQMSACQVLEVLEACQTGDECRVVSGEPQCLPIERVVDQLPLIIGLGVGIPAFLLLLIITVFLCYMWRNRTKKLSQHDSSEDRHNAFRSVFAGQLPTKGSWGASRFQMYSPDTLSDAASSHSVESHGRLLRSKVRGRSDFQDTPWYDNTSAPEPMAARAQHTPRETDDGPTSNFSWEYMFRVLEPLRNFEIQRPAVTSAPNRAYRDGKPKPESLA